jgi:peptidoglycan L-alanyl-D-glutamate endopeptidase CwlK
MPQLPVLRRYYEGPSVRILQMNLYGLNYTYSGLEVTGVFDSVTEDVVRNFQAEHKLKVDGIVGPATWGVLLEEVRRIQDRLNSAGFNTGAADGIFGPRTTNAVTSFQSASGLAVTGTVTPRTRQRLFNPDNPGDYDTRPSSASLDSLDPYVATLARRFISLANENGIDVRIISAFRSWDEQDRFYAQGRTTPGSIITDAMGGDSYHNWGLAFDAAPVVNGVVDWNAIDLFNRMGELGQQVGLEWGGNWTSYEIALIDRPHFQYTFGLSTQQLLEGARPPR